MKVKPDTRTPARMRVGAPGEWPKASGKARTPYVVPDRSEVSAAKARELSERETRQEHGKTTAEAVAKTRNALLNPSADELKKREKRQTAQRRAAAFQGMRGSATSADPLGLGGGVHVSAGDVSGHNERERATLPNKALTPNTRFMSQYKKPRKRGGLGLAVVRTDLGAPKRRKTK